MKCLKKIFVLGFCSFLAVSTFADTTHTIEKGDTLFSLSRRYGVTVDQICSANNMTRETPIKLGQKLVIPGGSAPSNATEATAKAASPAPATPATTTAATPSKPAATTPTQSATSKEETPKLETITYTVAKGDTWYGISRKNGISVPQLWALNNVDSTAELKAGQKIKIPTGASAVASTNGTSTTSTATSKPATTTSTTSTTPEKSAASDSSTSITSIAKLSDPKSYSKSGDTSLVWPVKATSVNYINGKVGGVKLVAAKDEAVKSIASGNVMFSGSYRGFGNVVFVQSKTSHIYAYTGLGKITVEKGDYIVSGSEIGKAGVDSYSKQNSVSLMVFQNGLPIDPAKAPRG